MISSPHDRTEKTTNILLVEDNPAHAEMVFRAFERLPPVSSVEIRHVSDGEQALNYLHRRGRFIDRKDSPTPDCILLDLRLPKVDGLDVLKDVKSDKDLKTIPVVILTTSDADADRKQAYDHFVNSYLVKPVDFDQFNQLMNDLGDYWFRWNHNPN